MLQTWTLPHAPTYTHVHACCTGKWDEAYHVAQFALHRPTAPRAIVQYYKDGDFCEEIQANRKVAERTCHPGMCTMLSCSVDMFLCDGDREGRYREGRDREGRDREGRDREGRDREGRDREGMGSARRNASQPVHGITMYRTRCKQRCVSACWRGGSCCPAHVHR